MQVSKMPYKHQPGPLEFDDWCREAYAAGLVAVSAITPVPMVVGTPTTLLGNKLDYAKPTYYVADGVCGFAWINVRPRNSAFARWLVKTGRGESDNYEKAIVIPVGGFNQSLAKKEAYAQAYALALRSHDVKAYARSRLD